jgi:hypothetical protein
VGQPSRDVDQLGADGAGGGFGVEGRGQAAGGAGEVERDRGQTVSDQERLCKELESLLPSAASDDALRANAPHLIKLASERSVPPRQLIATSVKRISSKEGRTSTPRARINYPFAQVGEGLDLLFGATAASYGIEARFKNLGKLVGATTPITGRRTASRFIAVLADELLAAPVHADPSVAIVADSLPSAPRHGVDILRERATTPGELVSFAQVTGLLLMIDWHPALAHVLGELYRHHAPGLEEVLDASLVPESSDAERLALVCIAAEAAQTLSQPDLTSKCARVIAAMLESQKVSRGIAANLTSLRRRAALILSTLGDKRMGVGLADGMPQQLFAPLDRHGSYEQAPTLIAVYPVTEVQYAAFGGASEQPAPSDRSLPRTNINLTECLSYCAALEGSLRKAATVKLRTSDGDVEDRAFDKAWRVALPRLDEIQRASGYPVDRYPWSERVQEDIGIARRLSYNKLQPVGLFADETGPTGALDLAGLIWQWLEDLWPADPSNPGHLRHVFGGGFGKNIRFFESACSLGVLAGTRRADRGFRVVLRPIE